MTNLCRNSFKIKQINKLNHHLKLGINRIIKFQLNKVENYILFKNQEENVWNSKIEFHIKFTLERDKVYN